MGFFERNLIFVDRCAKPSALIGVERGSNKNLEPRHTLIAGVMKTLLSVQ